MPGPLIDANTTIAFELDERGDATSWANQGTKTMAPWVKLGANAAGDRNIFGGQLGVGQRALWCLGQNANGGGIGLLGGYEWGPTGNQMSWLLGHRPPLIPSSFGHIVGKKYANAWSGPLYGNSLYWGGSGTGHRYVSIITDNGGGPTFHQWLTTAAGLAAQAGVMDWFWFAYSGTQVLAGREYIDASGVAHHGGTEVLYSGANLGNVVWSSGSSGSPDGLATWALGDQQAILSQPSAPGLYQNFRVDSVARSASYYVDLVAALAAQERQRKTTSTELREVRFDDAGSPLTDHGSAGGTWAANGAGWSYHQAGPLGNAVKSSGSDRNYFAGPTTPEPASLTMFWRGQADAQNPTGYVQSPFVKEWALNDHDSPWASLALEISNGFDGLLGGYRAVVTDTSGTRHELSGQVAVPWNVPVSLSLAFDGTSKTLYGYIGSHLVGTLVVGQPIGYNDHSGRWFVGAYPGVGAAQPTVGTFVDARLFGAVLGVAELDALLEYLPQPAPPSDLSSFPIELQAVDLDSELGVDIASFPDLDPSFPLVSGNQNVGQALARRLETPRGGLFYDPNYGTDVRGWLNESYSADALERLQGEIEAECEKDDRVRSASATVTSTGDGLGLTISISIVSSSGPFQLVLFADSLTVALLSVS